MTAAAPAKNFAPSQTGLVPKAVQRQAAEADRLMAELNAPPTPPAPGTAAAPPPAPPNPASMSPVPAAAPPAPPPVKTDAEKLAELEHKYNVLQGKYNTEKPLLQTQLQQQNDLIKDLLTSSRAPAPAPAVAPPTMSDEQKLLSLGITPKQIEEYGAELLMLMTNLGSVGVTPEIQRLAAENAELKRRQETLVAGHAQNSQAAVYAALNERVPTWHEINNSPEFAEWLAVVDLFAGVSKHTSLLDAFKKFDAARVVGIFQAFERENAARATATPPQVDAATLLTAQPRGQAPVAPEGSGKRIWSEGEVRDFYARVRKKKVSPEEYASTQQELALAVAEGRVKPDHYDHHANRQ